MGCYQVKLQVQNSGVAEVTPMTRVPHSLIHQAVFVVLLHPLVEPILELFSAKQGQLLCLMSWSC